MSKAEKLIDFKITNKDVRSSLKNVYKLLYGDKDMKIISDKKLDSFKWSYVPFKDK